MVSYIRGPSEPRLLTVGNDDVTRYIQLIPTTKSYTKGMKFVLSINHFSIYI